VIGHNLSFPSSAFSLRYTNLRFPWRSCLSKVIASSQSYPSDRGLREVAPDNTLLQHNK
jgi:hypothetical protein